MQILVGESESGTTTQMDVEPDATPIDVLDALKQAKLFGVDPATGRYIVSLPKSNKDLKPKESLHAAGVEEGDFLQVISSTNGY